MAARGLFCITYMAVRYLFGISTDSFQRLAKSVNSANCEQGDGVAWWFRGCEAKTRSVGAWKRHHGEVVDSLRFERFSARQVPAHTGAGRGFRIVTVTVVQFCGAKVGQLLRTVPGSGRSAQRNRETRPVSNRCRHIAWLVSGATIATNASAIVEVHKNALMQCGTRLFHVVHDKQIEICFWFAPDQSL